ncbi:hypothetical protein PCYB_145530, partial [Plasmodium cynomolgi strain B]
MEKGEDKRNAQGGVFTPAQESQPGKTPIKGSEKKTATGGDQTAVGGESPLRKLPYLLIPLSVRFPLLAKLLLLFFLSKWLKHAVGTVLISFLYRKNGEVFQQLIQVLLLQMRHSGGKKGSNKSNFKTVRPMVDAVYSNIEGMMKWITRVYFFLYGTPCSGLLFPEDINKKTELMSTPRRVSNLWVLRGAYLNLFVALLGHPGESDKEEGRHNQREGRHNQGEEQLNQREGQLNQPERYLPCPAEQTLYKNIRALYKVKYEREYKIMMRSECFSFLHRFCELVQHIARRAFSCLHLVLLTTMSIYCLCRSLVMLTHHIHALEKKKLYERCCEGGDASDELFCLLIESIALMSQDLAGEETPICEEANHPHDDEHSDGRLHIYDELQTKLRLCLNMINRIKGKQPRDASKTLVKQNPKQTQDFPSHEEPVSTYEPLREKEVYETEPSSSHTGGETANSDPTSQRKEQQRDGSLTYAVYLYESRTSEETTQGKMKRRVRRSTSVEDASAGHEHSSQERHPQRAQKEEDCTEGTYINGPMSNHIASCGNANETNKRHIEGGCSPHPSADPHGNKPPSNLSHEILINELKG